MARLSKKGFPGCGPGQQLGYCKTANRPTIGDGSTASGLKRPLVDERPEAYESSYREQSHPPSLQGNLFHRRPYPDPRLTDEVGTQTPAAVAQLHFVPRQGESESLVLPNRIEHLPSKQSVVSSNASNGADW